MEKSMHVPVQSGERIAEIDVIRGIALFGILVVNMSFFKSPVFLIRYPLTFPEGIDQLFGWVIQLFFTGKFYAIFSFLFGLGFYIFMSRTMKKGLELVPLYRRRLLVLLILGFVHLFFLWSGDILFNYALVGFILLKFRDTTPARLGRWIIALFCVNAVLSFLFGLLTGLNEIVGGEYYETMMAALIAAAIEVFSEGTFYQILAFRMVNELPYVLLSLLLWIPAVLAFFLCGFYAGKKEIFENVGVHLPLFRKICLVGFPVGALLLAGFALFETGLISASPLYKPALLEFFNYAASIFIFPAYVSAIVLLLQSGVIRKIMTPVAAAGRMALTNYLAQTLICIFLFNGFGFGLFGRVSLAQGFIITLVIYALQLAWSSAWFKKFLYGPMEWVWRALTYRKRQPFLIRR